MARLGDLQGRITAETTELLGRLEGNHTVADNFAIFYKTEAAASALKTIMKDDTFHAVLLRYVWTKRPAKHFRLVIPIAGESKRCDFAQ